MPTSLAEDHQAEQEAIAGHMLPQLAAAWALLDPANLEATVPRFREAVAALVGHYGQAAVGSALEYLRTTRRDAGIGGRLVVSVTPPPADESIDQLVEEVVAPLREAIPNEASSRAALDSGAQQLVLDQGRRQLIGAVANDRKATGWARVPNEGACSFCLMLALRGVLYRSKRAASFAGHHRKANGSGGDCKCTVQPVYGTYTPPARVRAAQALWESSTKDENGRPLGGNDARNAFRRAVEGRTDPAKKTTSA